MERDEFVHGTPDSLWLFKPKEELDYELVESRRRLGAAFEWTDEEWYDDETKRQDFFNFIESKDNRLWQELEQATDQRDKLIEWSETVATAAAPEAETAEAPAAAPSASAPAQAAPAAAKVEAPPRKALFAKKEAESTGDSAAAASASGAATAASAAAAPAAEPRKSLFAHKDGGAGEPAKAAEAATKAAEATKAADAAAPAEPAKSPFAHKAAAANEEREQSGLDLGDDLIEEIKTSMAGLEPEAVSEIADELELDADEVAKLMDDPEFAKMVEAELAALGKSE